MPPTPNELLDTLSDRLPHHAAAVTAALRLARHDVVAGHMQVQEVLSRATATLPSALHEAARAAFALLMADHLHDTPGAGDRIARALLATAADPTIPITSGEQFLAVSFVGDRSPEGEGARALEVFLRAQGAWESNDLES